MTMVQADGSGRPGRRRELLLAMSLAGLAGMVDAIGYIRLQHLFVSFMSGNSTQLAVAIGHCRFAEGEQVIVVIALFVAGAGAGQAMARATGRRHLSAVLVGVAALLVAAALLHTAPAPMILAMGALNAAMHRAGSVPVSLTYVTGSLVKLGQGMGDLLTGQANDWTWAEQALPWIGLLAGGILAAALQMRFGEAVDWMPVVWTVGLIAVSLVIPAPE